MKAVRATKNESGVQVTIEDIPKPSPGPGELLVQIKAAAVQPADILNSKGGFPTTTFPRTLGKDFSGTVVEGPQDWIGKDVYGTSGSTFGFTEDGSNAEFAILREDAVAVKPAALSHVQAAQVGTPWTTAYMTLLRAHTTAADTVMVLGATGSVGSAVVQIAKSFMGAKVIGVARHGTEINSIEDPELLSAKTLTDGKGPDVVVDTVGDLALTSAAFKVMARNGRISVISAPRQGSTEMALDMKDLYRREISIIGVNTAAASQSEMAKLLQELAPAFESGKLNALPESAMSVLGVDQAQDAYSGKAKRAVLTF